MVLEGLDLYRLELITSNMSMSSSFMPRLPIYIRLYFHNNCTSRRHDIAEDSLALAKLLKYFAPFGVFVIQTKSWPSRVTFNVNMPCLLCKIAVHEALRIHEQYFLLLLIIFLPIHR